MSGRARRLLARLRGDGTGAVVEDGADLRAAASAAAAQHRWFEAASDWHRLASADPNDDQAHRELARTAGEIAAWGGAFVGEVPTIRTIEQLAEDHPGSAVAADPVGVARSAMERAVELRPDALAWLAPLAELRERAGDLDGAIDAYEQAVAGTRTSRSAWVVKSRHLWQFHMERAHHRRGSARVDDPLFGADLSPTGTREVEAAPVGLCHPRFTHQGLRVTSLVADPNVASVELAIDGRVVRTANLGGEGAVRSSELLLRRSVLAVAPTRSRLTVATADGRLLRAAGDAPAVDLHLPHASGHLGDLLASGVRIDKKGGLTPTADQAALRQDQLLHLYDEVRRFLTASFGRDLFVLYGTLLGVHRQGELIPGDDDLDCGYVADAADPAAVKAEASELILALVRGGFSVSINRRGRLFRVHHDAIGDASLHLDVHPVWFEGADLYVHNHHRFPATIDDLLPPVEGPLRGGSVLVPRRPEVLLERFYGPGWRTPDPGYVDDSSGADPEVMARLDEALLTPDEHRAMAARLAAEPAPGQGRLVAIAEQSLYPLSDLVE